MYQEPACHTHAEWLWEHLFGDARGYLVTFTGRQARLANSAARQNDLSQVRQRSFRYQTAAGTAAQYLRDEAKRERDTYFAVHLFREPGNRRANNANPTVRALWLDEDGGRYPESGPEPTAVVHSSATRRHLYWALTRRVAIEWAVAMNRRIAAWSGGDAGKAGAASVLRVPGTFNYKRYPQVDPVWLSITGAEAWEPEVIEQAVPLLPPPPPAAASGARRHPYTGPDVEILDLLEAWGVEVFEEVPDEAGSKYRLRCPWVNEHAGGSETGTYVGQRAGGELWFHCHHSHCEGRRWANFRRRVARPRSRGFDLMEVTISYG